MTTALEWRSFPTVEPPYASEDLSSEYRAYNEQPRSNSRRLHTRISGLASREIHSSEKKTKQTLYICKKTRRLYFSKAAYIDIGILPKDFPNPAAMISTQANIAKLYTTSTSIHQESNANPKPDVGWDYLLRRPPPKKKPFPQRNRTLIGSRIGSWSISPKQH